MKNLILLLFILISFKLSIAQTFVPLDKYDAKSEILVNTDNSLKFINTIDGIYLQNFKTKHGEFLKLSVSGYYPDKNISFPELPVMARLIEVPYDADINIEIISFDEQIISLNDFGYSNKILPNQESLFKNQDPDKVPFEKSDEIYSDFSYYQPQIVQVNKKGIMRGVNIAQIIVNPFEYDIETNTLTVKNNIVVELTFENANISKSERIKTNKYSPAFEPAYRSLWNYKEIQTKDEISKYPIKYVIISDRMFEEALQDFIAWKTKKGFNVVTAYTDDIGSTTTAIKAFIQDLYEAGTTEDPAPTYALFVGDVAQIPSFQMSGHVSDMYYCEFDGNGDYVPEMYFGRFSATNVNQLLPQIEKTLMFEQFTFPDSDFIVESVLVAGDDSNFGASHGNGQINYATNYYFNEDKGVIDHTYLYPQSNSQAAAIISDISNGVGYVNYTAHCGSNGWAGPNFTTANIPNLQNDGKYFFSVGNCCQSNKFNDNECFGEALLRADKKGAVIHIGGSNNTMWDEDFYWSVGITSNINANTTYAQTTQAAYDHLFHDNGEEAYTTAYQMIFSGNMQVMASTSTRDKYYWEIYHVMGDPSVMPYVGTTPNLTAEYLSTIPVGMNNLLVTTEPDAYVALSNDGVLLDAKLADSNGEVTLVFESINTVADLDIVITRQFRVPHIGNVMVVPNDNQYDAMLQGIVAPQGLLHIYDATFMPELRILNLGQIVLETLDVGYILNDNEPVIINWEGSLETLENDIVLFPEISIPDGIHTLTAFVENPNGQEDEYESNNSMTRIINVYSGKVSINEIVSPENIICNQNTFIPEIIIKNLDDYPLTSITVTYTCNDITDELIHNQTIESNETAVIIFPERPFPAGSNEIVFSISEPNGGTNLIIGNAQLSKNFHMVHNGQMIEHDLLTDRYGSENTWELVDENDNILYSGGPYADNVEQHYIYSWCLGPGCYKYTIYDSYGDGMPGFMWFGTPGHVLITNLDTEEIILDLPGNQSGFNSSWSVEFCVENVVCPDNIQVDIEDNAFALSGAYPVGGVYSGEGVNNNVFNPEEAGEGEHNITYTYVFEGSQQEYSCQFNIIVDVSGNVVNNLNSHIKIYPNPTDGIMYFESPKTVNVQLFNMMGQKLLEFNNDQKISEIDISQLSNGTYFIKISDGEIMLNKKINLIK